MKAVRSYITDLDGERIRKLALDAEIPLQRIVRRWVLLDVVNSLGVEVDSASRESALWPLACGNRASVGRLQRRPA